MAEQKPVVINVSGLKGYLADNGVDVAQLYVLFKDFAKSMDFVENDPDMYGKFLLQNAIELIGLEIDPRSK